MKNIQMVTVAKSRIGQGLFAISDIPKNTIIIEIKGVLRSGDVDEKMNKKTRDNMLRFDSDSYISPEGDISDFLNHSCNPNSCVVKKSNKLFIKSLRKIKKDEEILIDYSTISASDDIWTMKCRCRSDNCRGVVKTFERLPKKLQQEYIKNKIVPKYILEINESL